MNLATTSGTVSLPPLPFSAIFNPKPPNSLQIQSSSLPFIPLLALSTTTPRKKPIDFRHPPQAIRRKSIKHWRISAVSEDALPAEVTPLQKLFLAGLLIKVVKKIIYILSK